MLRFRGAKERALVAALLMHANEVVSRERLIEALWRGRAPPSAVHSLEAYISRVRKTLGSDCGPLDSLPGGYRLHLRPEQLDRHRFEQLVEDGWRALAAGDARTGDERLGAALALWRGRPLPELAGEPSADLEAERLEELRLSALEGQMDAQLALGRHAALVGRLQSLVATYPLREGLQRLLMLALYRCGRQAEALEVYQRTRRRLVESLGLEPGPELQHLHEAILRQEPGLEERDAGEEAAVDDTPTTTSTPPGSWPRPQEERKVVTVLFCALEHATEHHPHGADPEDVHELLVQHHGRVRATLEAFGGTVDTFVGDSAAAFFGAPRAHEDDAERAVRAALAIREWAARDPDVHLQIGLETGEALVVVDPQPAVGEEIASSAVVTRAMRLQAAAPLDGILVGEQTYHAIEHAIECRPFAPRHTTLRLPLPVWEVLQQRFPLGAEPAIRSTAPLIGREPELAVLTTALERAFDRREPQLVTLVGVPGIGKTRLIAEFRAAATRHDRLLTWRQGRSLPYGDGASFWALAQIVKREAGVLETDTRDETARRLRKATERLFGDPGEARWVASHLRRLAGLGSERRDGQDRRGESFAAWRHFVEALADRAPLVLVFEDLHWADDGLLDFVEELSERLADVPVLIVASARPVLLAHRPAWAGGKPNATMLSLSPLSDEETGRLIASLPSGAELPAELRSALRARAEGNPFFAEELVRMVAARGGEALELPISVQAIIAARLDALAPQDKALLQDAAVVGDVFWPAALDALGTADVVVVERLRELERLEFVRRERRTSLAGESQYAFRHVLVRDVAYATIPRADRLERHRRTAAWIESLGRPDDHADLLAHHYGSALMLAQESGAATPELERAAVTALLRAGDRAYALNAFPTAARYYDEALAIGVTEESLGHVLLRLGAALNLAFDERRIEVLERARETLLAAGDRADAAEASALLADVWWKAGRPDRNRQELTRAEELLREVGASPTRARVLAQAARYAFLWMQPSEALSLAREALAIAERLDLDDVVVSTLNTIGCTRLTRGDRSGGVADLERAIELGLRTHDPETATAYHNLGILDADRDLEQARELQIEARQSAARLGNEPMVRWVTALLPNFSYQLGEWAEAIAAADAILADRTSDPPDRNARSAAQRVRARILLARDDEAEAERAIRDALTQVRAAEGSPAQILTLAAAAHVYHDLGRESEARAAAEELLRMIRPDCLFSTMHLAFALEPLGLADVLRDALTASPASESHTVARAIVDRDYGRAADLLAAGGSRTLEAEARLRAAAVLAEDGHSAEAEVQLDRALVFYDSVGASRYVRIGAALRQRLHAHVCRAR